MKIVCPNCQSEWETKVEVKKCPFCGANIETNETSPQNISDAIRILIQIKGLDVLHSPRIVRSYVMDLLPGFEQEKRLLALACDNGVLEEACIIVQESDSLQREVMIQKCRSNLVQNAFLAPNFANEILRLILSGVGVTDLSILEPDELDEPISKTIDLSKSEQKGVDHINAKPDKDGVSPTKKELSFKDGVYVGEAIGDRPHGYGTRLFTDGSKYEGEWNLGNRHGKGTYTSSKGESWSGEWKNNNPWNGSGIWEFKNDKSVIIAFDGTLKNGKLDGQGQLKRNGFPVEKGDFLNGCLHGQGIAVHFDITRPKYGSILCKPCKGEFKHGRPWNAIGTDFYNKTALFTGEWIEGKPHGQGTICFTDKRDEVEGNFDHGLNGTVVWKYQSGWRYEGQIQSGHLTGKGKKYNSKGELVWDGDVVNGDVSGKGIYYISDNQRYEGEMKDNKRNGQGTLYYPQGSWTGEWKDGKRWKGSGLILYYDKSGKPNGAFYNGNLVNGVAAGQGVYRKQDGTRLVGEWLDDHLYNGKIYNANNVVIDTYVNGVSKSVKSAENLKKVGDTLSFLSGFMSK